MIEEWRDIAGFEGLYQVSSLGSCSGKIKRVKNCKVSLYEEDKCNNPV